MDSVEWNCPGSEKWIDFGNSSYYLSLSQELLTGHSGISWIALSTACSISMVRRFFHTWLMWFSKKAPISMGLQIRIMFLLCFSLLTQEIFYIHLVPLWREISSFTFSCHSPKLLNILKRRQDHLRNIFRFLYFPYDNLYLFYTSPPAFLSLLYFRTTPLTASTRSTTLALATNATGSLSTTAIQSSPLYRYNCMVVSG